MTPWGTRFRHQMMRVLRVTVITALVPLPAFADGPANPQQIPTLKASAARLVARDVAAAPLGPARVREVRQGPTSTNSTAFFKSRPGIIALSVLAAGTGYALYSASHDRIHSAGKK